MKPPDANAPLGARGKRRKPAPPSKTDDTPDGTAGAGDGALAWRAADDDNLVGFGDVAFGFALGSSLLALPLAALFVLVNIGNVLVSLFTGVAQHWLIPERDMLLLLAFLVAALGASLSWSSIRSRNIIAYQIDLEAQTLTVHLARFPKRVDVVTIPFPAIVSLAPSMPGSFADFGCFYLTYSTNGLAPEVWQTRTGITEATLRAHADALRPALGERVRALVVYDS